MNTQSELTLAERVEILERAVAEMAAAAKAQPAVPPTPSQEEREKVARAIREAAGFRGVWSELPDWNRNKWLAAADAVLALRPAGGEIPQPPTQAEADEVMAGSETIPMKSGEAEAIARDAIRLANIQRAYEEECRKFQRETLRTSEQAVLLRRVEAWLWDRYHCFDEPTRNEGECCRIRRAIKELLARPINPPAPAPPQPETSKGESKCPACGEPGPHFAPPSMGEPGFYICERPKADTPEGIAEKLSEARKALRCMPFAETVEHYGDTIRRVEDAFSALLAEREKATNQINLLRCERDEARHKIAKASDAMEPYLLRLANEGRTGISATEAVPLLVAALADAERERAKK